MADVFRLPLKQIFNFKINIRNDMPTSLRIFLLWLMISTALAAQAPGAGTTVKPSSPAKTHAAAASRPAANSAPGLPSEDEVNGFMKAQLGWDPQATWKILSIKPSPAEGLSEVTVQMSSPDGSSAQKFYVSADGKHAVFGEIMPFGKHPFEERRLELEKKAKGPARGPAGAAVTVVEFSDLQCPHCKEASPTIERLLRENPNIHFVFENFPLPMHNWALKGAAYADCVGRASNDAFWKFITSVYAAQADITAENADTRLTELADQAGVKGADIAACSTQPETESRVQSSINLGKSLDVNATPTLFVNGRPIGVNENNYDLLKQLVDFEATEK
jgi:protein-disulfide isomerase